jgi:NADH-quinone oxidoreductase subunit J
MSASAIAFYLMAAFILITGILTVTTKKLFRAAIWLLFSLIGIAALYFWMEVEFAAAVQVIVYVGGIVVLIIFSIFLTNQEGVNMPSALSKRSLFAGLAVVSAAAYTCLLLCNHYWMKGSDVAFDPSVNKIGHLLVANTPESFVLPFELVSVLLLAAMVGCIVIAMKAKPETK